MPKTTKIYFLAWDMLKLRIDFLAFFSKKCWFRGGLHNFLVLMQSLVTYKWETLVYSKQEKPTNFILILRLLNCFRPTQMASIAMQSLQKCCRFNFIYFGWIGKTGRFKILWQLLIWCLSFFNSIGFMKSQDKGCWKQ